MTADVEAARKARMAKILARNRKVRKPTASEHAIQASFIEWVRAVRDSTKYRALRLAFAVPNGARVTPSIAVRLKAEGMESGIPDWVLPLPQPYRFEHLSASGLMIEFKSALGRLSEEQKTYRTRILEAGWRYEVCRTPDEAIAIVKDYLGVAK